ncbi:MAG: AzlC family ABC transporter permease [Waddliaceae bacterium]
MTFETPHTMSVPRSTRFRRAVVDSIPVFFGYFFLSAVWGVLWEQSGLPIFWAPFFSFFVYAGATQFIALPFILLKAAPLAMLLTVLPVSLRNSFYTVALIDHLPKKLWVRLLYTFTLVDAPFAILTCRTDEECRDLWYCMPLLLLSYLYWGAGTLVGVWMGSLLPGEFYAIDFALPALIAALAYEQLKKSKHWWQPLLIAIGSAAITRFTLGQDWLFPSIALCIAAILYRSTKGGAS